jgi:hypothetical protein
LVTLLCSEPEVSSGSPFLVERSVRLLLVQVSLLATKNY